MFHLRWGVATVGLISSSLGLSCPALERTQQVLSPPAQAPEPQVAVVAQEPPPADPVPEPLAAAPAETAIPEEIPEPPASVELPAEPPVTPDDNDTKPDMRAVKAEPDAGAELEGPTLGSIVKETWVFAKPSWKSRKIGYLRAGAVVGREEKTAGRSGCEKGWYRVAPRGYVCVGTAATLEASNAVLEAAARRPDRSQGLPYDYVMSKFPPPPLYLRLPSEEEQQEVERDASIARDQKLASFPLELGPIPGALLYEQVAPSLKGPPHARESLLSGRPVARSGFALLDVFEWTGRAFGLTTDMNVIPLDRTRVIKPSSFRGIALEPDQGLPAAFVRARSARRYRLQERAMADAGAVGYREGAALTGKQVRVGGEVYYETRDGTYLRGKDNLVVIPPMKNVPGWANQGRKWIDISILRQSLVAYEGTRPVYATLVSTGADGLGDPKKTHSTVQGAFLVHTKHVSATMDGDEVGDEFDLRDVPYVQYFHEGYALHAAYWHDEFGTPRSHGCVNLAPQDAAWLFGWSTPEVPEGWHGYLEIHGGTIVYTHP